MASVRLAHLRKQYDNGFQAVHDADFEIQDGEFVVLVGPSGCGKSTTLRMIAGLESISAGDALHRRPRVNDVPPKDRDIAMVFQNYALYPHMIVYDNMAFGLKLRKLPKAEIDQRVRQAADILGLDRRAGPQAEGALRRAAAARGRGPRHRAQPQVFLFDEPLSNLDAKLRVQMRTEISKLHRELERDDDLRDARPGGGDDDGRPHRGDEGRHRAADRTAAATSTTTRPTSSSPASSAARR